MNDTGPNAESRYLNREYLRHNPGWHEASCKWKFREISAFLARIDFQRVVEVGCGSGAILDELASAYPESSIAGFDISPHLEPFWQRRTGGIRFRRADFLETDETADLILLLDVFEHIQDYMSFLKELSLRSKYFIFHIPLDVFALASLTDNYSRKRTEVGHLHYFSQSTAIATLADCGYSIIEQKLTKPGFHVRTRFTRLLRLPRAVGDLILGPVLNARILGGYSLAVLCEVRV